MPLPLSPMDGHSGLFDAREWIAARRSPRGLQKWSPMRIHIISALVLLWCVPARANIITAATCSAADVQTAINSAVDGDTVNVPGPCSVAWAGAPGVTISKGITLNGGGNVTLTASYSISLQSSATASARVTGFTFSGGGDLNNGNIKGSGSKTNATWRIDHNTFPTAGSCVIAAWSNAPGLIDHNTFAQGGGVESIHNFGTGSGDTSGWVDDIVPGGPTMVFVEDNTFNNTSTTVVASAVQSYYGARTVVRHNTMIYSHVDQHGTPGSVGARWWEVYENTFNTPNVNQSEYITMRAGSGVVFNNHHTGTNTGSFNNITFKEEDTGTWPLAFQIGSGINGQTNQHSTCAGGTLNSSPAYAWGNDSIMTVSPQSGVQLNRDLFSSATQPATLLRFEQAADACSTTYIYTPYPYPHPLQGTSPATPAAPTGLAAVVH
jgi:hypothetical protein